MAVATCSRGHQWEVSAAAGQTASPRLVCPVCGEDSGETLIKPPDFRDTRPAEKTSPPALAAFAPDNGEATLAEATVRKIQPPAPRPLDVPGYEVVRLCGRGGMGVV